MIIPPEDYLLPYGVWWARALSRDGHPIAVAVDASHRIVDSAVVRPNDDVDAIARHLHGRLDGDTGVPHIRVLN